MVRSGPTALQADEPSLVDLFNTLWFSRRLLFTTALFIIAVGVIVVNQMELRYTASSSMMIGIPKNNLVDIEEVLNTGLGSRTAIVSEMEVLRSETLARKLVEKFDLRSRREFNPALRPPGLMSYLWPSQWIPEEWRESLGSGPAIELSEEENDQLEMENAINIFLAKLHISQVDFSNVIKVSFESTDPKLAAAIVNELPEAYIIGQMEAKLEATKKATEWLSEQLSDLKEKVENSENAVEIYREQHGLTEAEGSRILTTQLAEINRQMVDARVERAQAEVRLQQIKKLQKASDSRIESSREVMSSSVIQQLRAQEASLTMKASELAVQYGPKHNRIKQVGAEIKDVREKIDLEILRIVVGLENDVEVARSKEQSLSISYKELEEQSGKQQKESIRLRTLEREALANRALFDTFLKRFNETSSTAGLAEAEARIISKAGIPRSPSYPNKRKMLIMITGGAFGVAIILVLLLQTMNQGLLNPEQIEKELGLSTLGVIPTVPGKIKAYDYILEKPHSRFSEALNTLKTALILSSLDNAVKVLQITSSVPKEGKSTLALAFARMLAKSGNKVILVDGDLRIGSLEEKIGLSDFSKGLTDKGLTDLVMTSGGSIEEFVIRDEKSGAYIMKKGAAEFVNATDVFTSHRMQEVIDLLKKTFDYVIIDAPPVMSVSDARIIGTIVDKTLFVVQWDKTPRKVVKAALRQLIGGGADIAGCVLNQVNLQRYGSFSGGDSGYYYHYRHHDDYYTN
jgi:capsular exopolysaccharide synthesis family protein